jgi:prevent-host-death family protein
MAPVRIGIRELREGLSRALQRVRSGETMEVTDRGRPVARIVPIAHTSPGLTRLIEEGKLSPPRSRGTLPPPLDLPACMRGEDAVALLRGE